MAKFRADVDVAMYYPSLGVVVHPGDVVELPADTDAVGLVPVDAKATKKSASAPIDEPSVDAPTDTAPAVTE